MTREEHGIADGRDSAAGGAGSRISPFGSCGGRVWRRRKEPGPASVCGEGCGGAEEACRAGRGGRGRSICRRGVPVELLSGVTHEDCAAFATDFGTLLDVEDVVPGSEYTLEVSSPGLERRLTRAEEFTRFAGSLVKVKTFTPVNQNRLWTGRLTGFVDGVLKIEKTGNRKQGPGNRKTGNREQGTGCDWWRLS